MARRAAAEGRVRRYPSLVAAMRASGREIVRTALVLVAGLECTSCRAPQSWALEDDRAVPPCYSCGARGLRSISGAESV